MPISQLAKDGEAYYLILEESCVYFHNFGYNAPIFTENGLF